jgi:hypothetical protein
VSAAAANAAICPGACAQCEQCRAGKGCGNASHPIHVIPSCGVPGRVAIFQFWSLRPLVTAIRSLQELDLRTAELAGPAPLRDQIGLRVGNFCRDGLHAKNPRFAVRRLQENPYEFSCAANRRPDAAAKIVKQNSALLRRKIQAGF